MPGVNRICKQKMSETPGYFEHLLPQGVSQRNFRNLVRPGRGTVRR